MPGHWTRALDVLADLRRAFPHWGFLYNPIHGRWIAVQGRETTLTAPDAVSLYHQVAEHDPAS